jgi:hypothetical protein
MGEKLTADKQYFASQALLSVSTGIMRLSTAMVFVEIVKNTYGKMSTVSRINAGLIASWTLAAPLVMMVSCAPSQSRGIWMCPAEVSVVVLRKKTEDTDGRAGTEAASWYDH